jgi:hypothetical protein
MSELLESMRVFAPSNEDIIKVADIVWDYLDNKLDKNISEDGCSYNEVIPFGESKIAFEGTVHTNYADHYDTVVSISVGEDGENSLEFMRSMSFEHNLND